MRRRMGIRRKGHRRNCNLYTGGLRRSEVEEEKERRRRTEEEDE